MLKLAEYLLEAASLVNFSSANFRYSCPRSVGYVIIGFDSESAKISYNFAYSAAPTVQLLFNSQLTKSKAEKFRLHILQAFESVLRCPVTIEIRCESRKGTGRPILLPAAQNLPHLDVTNANSWMPTASHDDMPPSEVNRREIVEIEASPGEHKGIRRRDENIGSEGRNLENAGVASSQKISTVLGEKNQCLTLVKSKVSLAHVIQHAEGCSQHSGWSKRKAVSIAEKLEQENL